MEKQNDALWEFDRAFGVPLCGVDEAGRGPLAGPVFAACAVCASPAARSVLPSFWKSAPMEACS